ncbi:cupredoxin domain-containing protein [Streptomyces sp. NPDC087866]|uniref:cupredoxin domain-containing protein n=1 Tax=Streptomyces sp. NPDC087866 TaxID=3365815 RepID=UPI0037FE0081
MPRSLPAGAARLIAATVCVLVLAASAGCSNGGGGGGDRPTESATSAATNGGGAKITIKDFKFRPASLTVPPGSKVTVINSDTTTHTLTASKGSLFDTGDIAPGKSVIITAPVRSGDFPYTCTIHPFMKGALTAK